MPKSVLVLGAGELACEALVSQLKLAGYLAMAPTDAPALDDLIVLGRFDAVICDVSIVDESMSRVVKYVRTKNIPLVLLGAPATPGGLAETATAFLAKPVLPSELISVLEICTADRSVPNSKTLLSEGYCRVAIQDFMMLETLRFDIYLRLNSEKFLKIARRGEHLSRERLRSYHSKGARFLYLRCEDFAGYLGLSITVSERLAHAENVPLEERLRLVTHAEELILERLHAESIDTESLDAARTIVTSSVTMLAVDQAPYKLMDKLKTHSASLFTHAIGVSFYAALIARGLGLSDPVETHKIAIGGLLHDIGKKEFELELLNKSLAECNAAELRLLETHGQRGIDILCPFKNLPNEILRIIFEHHENPAGLGYPRGLRRQDIHPYSQIVSVADDFCYLTLPSADGEGVAPETAFHLMWKRRHGQPNSSHFESLLRAFRMQIDEKTGAIRPEA